VRVRVTEGRGRLRVQITDLGGTIAPPAELPNLGAKLAELESPRGWGRFLIENMVDETNETAAGEFHTVELTMRIEPSDETR
jgi:anti-sigma regulatory factor (Ser/Thr protein kinase)